VLNSPFKYPTRFVAEVAQEIGRGVVRGQWDSQRRVFICGAATHNRTSVRSKVAAQLREHEGDTISIYYPEHLFDELLTGVGHHDLLSLENLLAQGVTAIVIVLESAGALTELGAFANHEELSKKLIVLQDAKYSRDRSFVQLGPIRFLKSQDPSRVIEIDFAATEPDVRPLSRVLRRLVRIAGDFRIDNVFHTQEFLLPVIYVLHVVSRHDLAIAVAAGGGIPLQRAEAALAASLTMLLAEGLILATSLGFTLTAEGQKRVRNPEMPYATRRRKAALISQRNRVLDDLRVSVLNRVCRHSKGSFPRS
jgi:hypothetical protein